MEYKYSGRLSPTGCWMAIFQFDSCDNQEKPVIALKSGIHANGVHLRRAALPHRYLSGSFEVVKRFRTSQKYDYASLVKTLGDTNVEGLQRHTYMKNDGSYFGIVIDYTELDKLYKVALGPVVLDLSATFVEANSNISPELLACNVICVRLKISSLLNSDSLSVSVLGMTAKQFPVEQNLRNSTATAVPRFLSPEYTSAISLKTTPERSTTTRSPSSVCITSCSGTSSSRQQLLVTSETNEVPESLSQSAVDIGSLANRLDSMHLSEEEFEDLAPRLPLTQTILEKFDVYTKPVITVGANQ